MSIVIQSRAEELYLCSVSSFFNVSIFHYDKSKQKAFRIGTMSGIAGVGEQLQM